MSDNAIPQVDLVEVLSDLREEIGRAQRAAVDEDVLFTFSAVRIELSVAVEKKATGKGGVKFWVVEAGAEAAYGRAATHRLSFDLLPTSRSTGTSPQVNDTAMPGEY